VRIHPYNGNFTVVDVREDDEVFYARHKERLQRAHPELSVAEVDKIIVLQDRLADTIFDVWLKKQHNKTASSTLA
jgi:hypothetical protein